MWKILTFILLLCVATTLAFPSIQAETNEGPMLNRLNRAADHYGGGHNGHGGSNGHGSGHGSGHGGGHGGGYGGGHGGGHG
ncbi:glycine-rich cell wall structural protein-like [Vespa mandarinia]|uniref:glycine-rich cell wall structural protein-like n=1 Tax=Vespa mandarinia TaxID=7446 RepID=UPI00160AE2F8|nr:glycine-rich cell wall structural protein-like [Vespa mandarinia]